MPTEFEDSFDDDYPDDYFDDGQDDPVIDFFEEAMSDCGGFFDGNIFHCGHIGSEECEFECPFNKDIGKSVNQIRHENNANV